MRTSSNTSSGRSSRMARRASWPLPASPTSVICGSRSSSERSCRRASGSSSAMRVVIGSDIHGFFARDAQRHRRLAAANEQVQRESFIAIDIRQSAARDIEADAEAGDARVATLGEAFHLDAHGERLAVALGFDQYAAMSADFDAVPDGILDQGLQDERGHQEVGGAGFDRIL